MSRYLLFLCLLLTLVSCSRERTQGPEVARQRAEWEGKGWTFVEVCGDSNWKTESTEVRMQGDADSLTVYASSSGIDGHYPKEEIEKTFAEAGHTFLEVKTGTGPADTYSIVFKKKVEPSTSQADGASASKSKTNAGGS